MEDNVLWKAFIALGGFTVSVLAWVCKNLHGDVSSMKMKQVNSELDLERFKTHVALNHPDKTSVSSEISGLRQETRESTQRLHERMDGIADDIKALPHQILTLIKGAK